jgi:uncharacterized protein YndB with AHSA1/START domain
MIEPVTLHFTVDCGAAHAFATWTERVSTWWPTDHTVSREVGVSVVFEPGVGGRIFERTASGSEVDWGSVIVWEPPERVVYRWHLMFAPAEATEVEVTFATGPDGTTDVTITHRGWDALAAAGQSRRDRNEAGWKGVAPLYAAACGAG